VEIFRRLAGVNLAVFEPYLASALSAFSGRLSDLGRREALQVTTEAVEIRCRLAGVDPAAFEPDLAGSLDNLGIWLSDLGRLDKAIRTCPIAAVLHKVLRDTWDGLVGPPVRDQRGGPPSQMGWFPTFDRRLAPLLTREMSI
jgi:hypothetical protein